MSSMDRREFLAAAGTLVGLVGCTRPAGAAIIDFHQHTHYVGRSDADLVAHQRKLGVAKTVLLPAGSRYGLAADAWGNDSVVKLASQYPEEFVYFANELPDLPETRAVLEKHLKMGARGDWGTEVQGGVRLQGHATGLLHCPGVRRAGAASFPAPDLQHGV